MQFAYIFPEPLPLKKARAISVINTLAHLSRLIPTTLILSAESGSKQEIEEFYGVDLKELKFVFLPSKVLGIKSNKIFHYFLRKKLHFFDVFYIRHLKTASFLIKYKAPNQKIIFEAHEVFSETLKEEAPEKYKKIKQLKELEKMVYEKVDAFVFTSNTLKKFFEKRFKIKEKLKKVIYHATTFEVPFVKKNFSEVKEVFYCGSLYPWKGIDTAIKALSLTKGVKLKVIGGEKNRIRKLKSFAESLGVGERVEFFPFKKPIEVKEILLNKARITLIPNKKSIHNYFSFPIKLLEYMATSNIVIAADTPVIKEVIKDGVNGFLFKTGDPDSLRVVLEKVLSLPSYKLEEVARNAYETAKNFTYENRAKKIIEFCEKIKNEKR